MNLRGDAGRVVAPSVICLLSALALGGCGSDDTSSDGGPVTADGGSVEGVATPDIPWLAEGAPPLAISPCADGWREVRDEVSVVTCDPYPEGGAVACPEGQAHFTGEAGCAPVGAACPTGEFADGLPGDVTVVHVQPGATGGDGSLSNPYGSLAEFAHGGMPAGSVIALSAGTHEGPVHLGRGHVLWGACAARTTLRAPTPSRTEGVVTLAEQEGEARNLTIADSPRVGLWLEGEGARAELDGVVVTGTEGGAVVVILGAHLSAHTLVASGTPARSADGSAGNGLTVQVDSSAQVSRAILERNHAIGILVSQSSSLSLTDAVVRETQPRVRDGMDGRGLGIQFGATVQVARTLFDRNHTMGVFAGESGTMVQLDQVVIRDTQSRASDDGSGRGLNVQKGATAEVTRSVIERNRSNGVLASDPGTVVSLLSLVVRDTESQQSDGLLGRGIDLERGATVSVAGALLARNRDIGIYASGVGTIMMLEDAAVRDTRGRASDGHFGRGLNVQEGAAVGVSRALFLRNRVTGVLTSDADSTLSLDDALVQDTGSEETSGLNGRGLVVQFNAMMAGSRTRFEGNREVGVLVAAGGNASLQDVTVSGTRSRDCSESSCLDEGAGHGAGSYGIDTMLRMTRFAVLDSELCGAHVAIDGGLDLEDGVVSDNAIGLCVQVDPYDTERLTANVRYADNEVNLQTTSLPVPDPGETAVALGP